MLLDHDAANIGFSADELLTASLNDLVIQRVRRYLESGWSNKCEDQLQPYAARKNELSFENRMIIWLQRIVVPVTLITQTVDTIHLGHPGICAMKSIARIY
ncbi:hypothetical protein GJ496_000039 [Pomphorhynchus laevis]|nr:hypothetical protein GJ496_000039 [Pomphorhynchus laevis]